MTSLPLISNHLFLAAVHREARTSRLVPRAESALNAGSAEARAVPLEVLYNPGAVSASAAAKRLRPGFTTGKS